MLFLSTAREKGTKPLALPASARGWSKLKGGDKAGEKWTAGLREVSDDTCCRQVN